MYWYHAILFITWWLNWIPKDWKQETFKEKGRKQRFTFSSEGPLWLVSLDGHDKLCGYDYQNSTSPRKFMAVLTHSLAKSCSCFYAVPTRTLWSLAGCIFNTCLRQRSYLLTLELIGELRREKWPQYMHTFWSSTRSCLATLIPDYLWPLDATSNKIETRKFF